MKIEQSTLTKLLISEAPALDPITVIIEDLGVRAEREDHKTRQGKVIVECYGESWSAYWGSMGDRTVAQFMADVSVDYLAGCLNRGMAISTCVFSSAALIKACRQAICDRRRSRNLSKWHGYSLDSDEARKLWDRVEDLRHFESVESLQYSSEAGEALTEMFGEEWHYGVQDHGYVENPRYAYLKRVIEAAQEGIRKSLAEPTGQEQEVGIAEISDSDLVERMRAALERIKDRTQIFVEDESGMSFESTEMTLDIARGGLGLERYQPVSKGGAQ